MTREPWFRGRRRLTIRRWARCERWRIGAALRVFRGNGLANFEFEFRLGFPRHSPSADRQIKEMFSVDVEDARVGAGGICGRHGRVYDGVRCPACAAAANSHSQGETA